MLRVRAEGVEHLFLLLEGICQGELVIKADDKDTWKNGDFDCIIHLIWHCVGVKAFSKWICLIFEPCREKATACLNAWND